MKNKKMNKRILFNARGFTLAEVVVSVGLLGIVALGFASGSKYLLKIKDNADKNEVLQSNANEALGLIKRYTEGLSWEKLDYKASYFHNKGKIGLENVSWDLSDLEMTTSLDQLDVDIRDLNGTKITLRRDSHTAIRSRNGKTSAYFSRCVPTSTYLDKKQNIDISTVSSLTRVPYLVENGKISEIYCCPRNSTSLCGDRVKNSDSPYRVMSFVLTDKLRLKVFPAMGERKYLLGVGLMIFLNEEKSPSAFKAYSMVMTNSCSKKSDGKNCKKNGLVRRKLVSGPLSTRSLFDSGQIIIN